MGPCSISHNVHTSVLNGALWDMEQVHSGISQIGLLLESGTQSVKMHHAYQEGQVVGLLNMI